MENIVLQEEFLIKFKRFSTKLYIYSGCQYIK